MTLVERFFKYVSFDTQSNEESGVTPRLRGKWYLQVLERRIGGFGVGRDYIG